MRCSTEPVLSDTGFDDYDFDQSCFSPDDGFIVPSPTARIGPMDHDSGREIVHGTDSLRPLASLKATVLAPRSLREIPGVVPASRLELPPVPTVSSGLTAVDTLTGGLPRGSLTEICGPASSGRTSLMLTAIADATSRGELCALVDAADCFDPHSAQAAGVDLDRLLWIRCSGAISCEAPIASSDKQMPGGSADLSAALHAKQQIGTFMPHAKVWYGRPPARSERAHEQQPARGHQRRTEQPNPKSKLPLEQQRHGPIAANVVLAKKHWAHRVDQALKATDLLLQAGGFGMVVIDLGDVPAEIARRVPLTSWFRFRRAVENTPGVLLAVAQESCARTCASLVLQLHAGYTISPNELTIADTPTHARIFQGLTVTVEVLRSRLDPPATDKKPPRPVRVAFDSRTQWAG